MFGNFSEWCLCPGGAYAPANTVAVSGQIDMTRVGYQFGFFRLVFGWYFSVFPEPIPEENLVGTFRYYYFGGNPFFP